MGNLHRLEALLVLHEREYPPFGDGVGKVYLTDETVGIGQAETVLPERFGGDQSRPISQLDILIAGFSASQIQQQPLRILQALLDAHQEGHRVLAVDDAVVVAERQVHHRPDHDLAVAHHRALLDAVHAEDARLRRVEDRRRHQRAVDAAVGDGERAALHVLDAELAVAGALAEVGDGLLDLGKRHAGRRRAPPAPPGPCSVPTATPMS